MKYKVIIFFLFALSLCSHAVAQRIRFCDSTNQWMTKGYDSAQNKTVTTYFFYKPGAGQLMLDGYYYLNLRDSSVIDGVLESQREHYVREDTTRGIVYFMPPPYDETVTSCILYNYNLHTGDTVHHVSNDHIVSFHADDDIDSVINVDSVLIGGRYYKRITILEVDSNWHESCNIKENMLYTYIEGIGGLSKPCAFLNCGNYDTLQCFSTNGVAPAVKLTFPDPYHHNTPNSKNNIFFINNCTIILNGH